MCLKYIYTCLITLVSTLVYSQNIIPSYTYVQSCYNNQECYSINNSTLIFFNPRNEELTVLVDFSKFKVGNDTLDEWINYLPKTELMFKGSLNLMNSQGLSHQMLKPISVSGHIYFNDISLASKIDLSIWRVSGDGTQSAVLHQNEFDKINVALHISIHHKDFKIDSKHHHYKKTIDVVVSRGYINALTPDLEFNTNK